jgi:hypothetical protein
MMTQDTTMPERWRSVYRGVDIAILNAEGGTVAVVREYRLAENLKRAQEIQTDYARLITAAPALRDALKDLVPLIAAEYPHQQAVWLEEARAALAACDGKESE